MTIHRGDVGVLLPANKNDLQRPPAIVMVDPPRAGLSNEAIRHIVQLSPQKITYIFAILPLRRKM